MTTPAEPLNRPRTSSLKGPFFVTLVGLIMVVLMIIFEDEPGGIPMLVFVSGLTWLVARKIRLSKGV